MNSVTVTGYSLKELLQRTLDTLQPQSVWITDLKLNQVVEDLSKERNDVNTLDMSYNFRLQFELTIEYAKL